MIQKEFRLVYRGIQLISVLEIDEVTKNVTVTHIHEEEINKPDRPDAKNDSTASKEEVPEKEVSNSEP